MAFPEKKVCEKFYYMTANYNRNTIIIADVLVELPSLVLINQ